MLLYRSALFAERQRQERSAKGEYPSQSADSSESQGSGTLNGKPFTVFALVGAINAVNHSDGLDGLAAGECMLSLIALATLGFLAGSTLVMGLALAAVGGLLGFLRYNSHPARVFMGDSGSQVLGFTVAFLTIYLTQVADTALSAALPLLLLGVPIADILAVLYQRIAGGMNWFKASRNHVHHRLLDLGFRHYETVIIIYSIQASLVVSAVLLRYQSDSTIAAVYLLVAAALFAVLTLAERSGWRHDDYARGGLRMLPVGPLQLRQPLGFDVAVVVDVRHHRTG